MKKTLSNAVCQKIEVPFSYEVLFTRSVFSPDNPALQKIFPPTTGASSRMVVFVDSGVHNAHPRLKEELSRYLETQVKHIDLVEHGVVVPGGEAAKGGWSQVNMVLETLQQHRLCRHSFVLAIGGGAVLDAVGLGAGLFHRGVRLIRIPTTTLSQGDSGMGVKNGINLDGVKNMVGSFNPPFAVINDFELLWTLEPELILDGMAEALKVAVIKDSRFLGFLYENAEKIRGIDKATIEEATRRSALIHLDHISASDDPFEFGVSRPLDFGHWSAHRLEGLSGYAVRHGQAVAIGICLDALYAWKTGYIGRELLEQIHATVKNMGLPLFHPLLLDKDEQGDYRIIEGIELFREHLGGKLSVTLPTGPGESIEVHEIDADLMRGCIEELAEIAGVA